GRRRRARDRVAARRPCPDDRPDRDQFRGRAAVTAPRVISFGCRLNSYESAAMREIAGAAGLVDAVIVNTCAVTAEAERQARQAIRKARREQPGARIIVTGCAAQIHPEAFAAMPEVDRVVGNDRKFQADSFDIETND